MTDDKRQAFAELYPFQSRTLSLNSLRYHYLDEGQGDAVLMLHGNPTWSFYYRNLILGLRDRCRCVAPDHMGCGLSDKPQQYDYTLARHIDNLEALVEHLGLTGLTLAMHDWGGAIGMGYAVRHPERVKRLVLFNTAAFLSRQIPWSINLCRLPLFGPLAVRGLNAFAGLAVSRACRRPMSPQVKAGYLAPYDTYANRVAILRFVQDIPMSRKTPSFSLVKSMQEQLTQFAERPVLILWGKKDFCFNDHYLERWLDYFPEAEVHEFADAGHYVVEDAHERIVPLMQKFFADHPPNHGGE